MPNLTIKTNSNANIYRAITPVDTFCRNCGCVIENDDDIKYVDGDEWCEDCADRDAVRCPKCDCLTEDGTTVTVYVARDNWWRMSTAEWCETCAENHATECEDCEELFSDELHLVSEYSTWDGGCVVLCQSCLEDHYRQCESCGELVHDDEACYNERNDAWYCPDCYEENSESENVHDYGRTDGSYFWYVDDKGDEDCHYDSNGELYIGVELETAENDDRSELADNIIDEFGNDHFECKEDGSLGSHGLEIVSQPFTPKYHLVYDPWSTIVDYVRQQNGVSHNGGRCGLHMHVNRDALTEGTDYRIDRLLHRFRKEFINFSRRDDFYYCHLDEDDLADIEDVEERKSEWKKKKSFDGRYVALNTGNYYTIEIRLWRGTLNMETFRATIEMTTGLIYVCNAISDEFADELDWERLKLLVRYALEEYDLPHDDFDAYIERRGL